AHEIHAFLRTAHRHAAGPTRRTVRREASMNRWHFQALLPTALCFVALALLPLAVGESHLSLLTLVLMCAFFGQAWNLMMGFVGQLSLGHALYAGIGAYSAAVAIGTFGVSPWLALLLGVVLSAAAGRRAA